MGGARPRDGDGHDRRPRRRAPASETWEDADDDGEPLNRTLGLAVLGGATLDTEENYLLKKSFTAAGRGVDREPGPHMTLARTVPGLGTSFGRGGATTFQQDLQNSDCILIMGSNMAEQHPVGFQWVIEAKERGAKVIHVDPRFTRTSAMADLHVPLRAGTDIAFLGGVIHHILENGREFREYVQHYTNAPRDPQGGVPRHRGPRRAVLRLAARTTASTRSTRGATRAPRASSTAGKHEQTGDVSGDQAHGAHGMELEQGEPPETDCDARAPALRLPGPQAPLRALHAGDGRASLRRPARAVPRRSPRRCARTPGRERTSAFCYAVGWTQHTTGVQNIRAAAIIQLLLGNIGRPGGGILALRGHANIQGSTDIPTLYDILPGYIPMPHPQSGGDLDEFVEKNGPDDRRLGRAAAPTRSSLLKAWWGDAATAENDCGFGYLPRIDGDHSHYPMCCG